MVRTHIGLRDFHCSWDSLLACSVELTSKGRMVVVKKRWTSCLETHDSWCTTRRVEEGTAESLTIDSVVSLIFPALGAFRVRTSTVDTTLGVVLAAILPSTLSA